MASRLTYHATVAATDRTTRERILDVAFELFAEVGFAGTTVTAIEERAGLTPGSGGFYRHFRSKEDLLPKAIEREVDRCMAAFAESQTSTEHEGDSGTERRRWLETMYRGIQYFDPLLRLMLTDGYRVPEVRAAITSTLQGLGMELSWGEQPELVTCLVALGGYHFFSEVQGHPFHGVPSDEFIRVLDAMTSESP